MAKEQKTKKSKEKTPRQPRRRFSPRRRRQSTSIFFLLWTVIALLSLFIVLLLSVSQRTLLVHSYKEQATREIAEQGVDIHEEIERTLQDGPPPAYQPNNVNGYIRFLNKTYNVEILLIDEDGRLLYPTDNLEVGTPEYEKYYDQSENLRLFLEHWQEGERAVIFEGEGECVYGAKLTQYDRTVYLHIGKSLQLMETTLSRLAVRTVLLGLFVVVLTFAISSAVAGLLVNPLTELTEKAHRLAEGDFDVDFHGADYGRELVELADSLNFARDELSKTDRMQKELIANVSHDFKTPLTMIKGYASMIVEISGDNPEKRNKHAQIIIDEADRLAALVGDMLDLSKIQSGLAQLQMESVDMSAYLQEVLDRFAYLRDARGYQFVVDIEKGLHTTADKLKIGQALYNLVGNAVNYTGEDKRVYISLKEEGDTFRFAVRDTGKGIKKEELNDIWERYYRSSEMHKRPVKGTGLGLSIVKSVLERHAFRFGVESEVGKGSTFFVIFPKNG